jgi:hypothetical protein
VSAFVPFLDYDVEIRKVICSTTAIESINARYRSAVKARGHFPTEAALKCLYLVTRSLDPTGKGRARWAMRWKPALNAFAITFAGRPYRRKLAITTDYTVLLTLPPQHAARRLRSKQRRHPWRGESRRSVVACRTMRPTQERRGGVRRGGRTPQRCRGRTVPRRRSCRRR